MKKHILANVSLFFGVTATLLPICYGFGNALLITILGKPILYALADKNIFLSLFSLIVFFSIAISLAGLLLKPRPLRKEMIKMFVGLTLTMVTLIIMVKVLLSK
jgi:hypothetical protein